LEAQQADDGSFAPVWFGNEYQAKDENLVLGTAQVLTACAELHGLDSSMAQRAVGWLQASQHSSGGWGPPRVPVDYSDGERNRNFRSWRENDALAKFCSVEETAAAVTALLPVAAKEAAIQKSVSRGLAWLTTAVEQDRHRQPAIVGFYLGQIWFRERLYPLVFAAGALTQAVATMVAVAREPAVSS
jgi:squalene-hopene/tetraprenyl-beta-curcumene cyclase